jgi:hypothetical protein
MSIICLGGLQQGDEGGHVNGYKSPIPNLKNLMVENKENIKERIFVRKLLNKT